MTRQYRASSRKTIVNPELSYRIPKVALIVHDTQFIVPTTHFIVHDTQFIVHDTQFFVHVTQFMVHATQFFVHVTQFIVIVTQSLVHFDFLRLDEVASFTPKAMKYMCQLMETIVKHHF